MNIRQRWRYLATPYDSKIDCIEAEIACLSRHAYECRENAFYEYLICQEHIKVAMKRLCKYRRKENLYKLTHFFMRGI